MTPRIAKPGAPVCRAGAVLLALAIFSGGIATAQEGGKPRAVQGDGAGPPSENADSAQGQAWEQAWQALERARSDGADPQTQLDRVEDVLAFEGLPTRRRIVARFWKAEALFKAGELEKARDLVWTLYDKGMHFPGGLLNLVQLERKLGNSEGEAKAVRALADNYPDQTDRLNVGYFIDLYRRLRKDAEEAGGQAHLALLDSLYRAGFRPVVRTGSSPDFFYQELIRYYIDQGRDAAARRLSLSLTHYSVMATVKLDGRYAAIRDFVDAVAIPSMSVASERALRHAESLARNNADAPLARLRHVEELVRVGRFEAAVAEADAALTTFRGLESQDHEKDIFFLENMAVYALHAQRREGQARDRMARFAEYSVSDHPDAANQFINFGFILLDIGRPREAVAMARRALADGGKHLSAYGTGYVRAVEVCGLQAQGDTRAAAEALAWFEANVDVNSEAHAYALICRDDDTALADLFRQRLTDPDQRGAALRSLQPMRIAGPMDGALFSKVAAALARLKTNKAVQQTMTEAGRVLQDEPLRVAYINVLE